MQPMKPEEVRDRIFKERNVKPQTSVRCQQKRKKEARDRIEEMAENAIINREFSI